MIEHLLAGQEDMKAKADANREQMLAKMETTQEKTDTSIKANQEQMLARIEEKMNTNRKANREELKGMINVIQEKVDASIANRKDDRKETTAWQDAMEASLKKNGAKFERKEAVVERQEIPNEVVAIHSLLKRDSGLPRSDRGRYRED
jgi:hypothetical protein